MAPGVGVNLRVTTHSSQGGRKYTEDIYSIWHDKGDDLHVHYSESSMATGVENLWCSQENVLLKAS
jgi:hypothetical protein